MKCFGTLKQFWRDETTPELPISLRKFVKFFKGCFCSIEQLNNLLTVHPIALLHKVVNIFLNRNSYSLIKCLWVLLGLGTKGHLVTLTTLRGSYHPHQRRNCCWNGCQLFEKLESNWMRNLEESFKKQAERISVKVSKVWKERNLRFLPLFWGSDDLLEGS